MYVTIHPNAFTTQLVTFSTTRTNNENLHYFCNKKKSASHNNSHKLDEIWTKLDERDEMDEKVDLDVKNRTNFGSRTMDYIASVLTMDYIVS